MGGRMAGASKDAVVVVRVWVGRQAGATDSEQDDSRPGDPVIFRPRSFIIVSPHHRRSFERLLIVIDARGRGFA